MEIIIKLDTNSILDVLRTRTQHNIKNFVKYMDYEIFEEVIMALIEYEYGRVNIIQDIIDGRIKIYDHDELDELDDRYICFYSLSNGFIMGIDFSI